MTALERLFCGFVVLPTTVWVALAVHYHVGRPWLRWLAPLVPPAVVGVGLALLPVRPWALSIWLGVLLATVLWWLARRPKSDRDWKPGLDVWPGAELAGDTLRVKQFRNFDYTPSGEPLPRYEERTFDLTKLASLDYLLSHWSGSPIAHTLLSFGFDDGQFLVLSVEARLRRGSSYSPLRGLFRAYELFFVIGDERDVIRLRTNIRGERVYLYRVRLPRQEVRRLLVDYLDRAVKLEACPEWYNSLTSNCTTNLFYHSRNRVPWWLMPHIVVNGLSARALYLRGFLDDRLPFKDLRARGDIRERALAAGDGPTFSRQIRTHIDGGSSAEVGDGREPA